MATLLGVLGSGLLRGVMIGAAISLVQLLRAHLDASRRGARSHSRDRRYSDQGAASGERTDSRRADLPARVEPALFQRRQRLRRDPRAGRGEVPAAEARRARSFRRAEGRSAERAHARRPRGRTRRSAASVSRRSRRVRPCATASAPWASTPSSAGSVGSIPSPTWSRRSKARPMSPLLRWTETSRETGRANHTGKPDDPKAAAIAGMLSSVLMLASFWLL